MSHFQQRWITISRSHVPCSLFKTRSCNQSFLGKAAFHCGSCQMEETLADPELSGDSLLPTRDTLNKSKLLYLVIQQTPTGVEWRGKSHTDNLPNMTMTFAAVLGYSSLLFNRERVRVSPGCDFYVDNPQGVRIIRSRHVFF